MHPLLINMFCPIKATKVKKSHRSDVINNNGNNSSSNNNNNNNNNSNNNTNGNNHNNQSNNSEANNPSNNLTSENINTHINNTNNNNINGHNNNNNHHHHHHENANPIRNHHHVQYPTGNPYRYVIQDYAPKQADELEVYRGDRVFFDYEVDCSGKAWSYVFCMKRNRDGFVPSANLSTEPIRNQKIKMPHISSGDNISPNLIVDERAFQHQQHQLHHQHNSHLVRDKCAQRSRGFGVGARMYQDLSSLHAYGNLQHSNSFELKCTPFPTDNCGLYVVTHSFVAREENDLSVNSGEYIVVLNKEDEDWFWVRRECDQAEGFVPSRYICDLEQVKSILNKGNSTVTMKSSMNQNDFHTYINQPNDDDKLLRC